MQRAGTFKNEMRYFCRVEGEREEWTGGGGVKGRHHFCLGLLIFRFAWGRWSVSGGEGRYGGRGERKRCTGGGEVRPNYSHVIFERSIKLLISIYLIEQQVQLCIVFCVIRTKDPGAVPSKRLRCAQVVFRIIVRTNNFILWPVTINTM